MNEWAQSDLISLAMWWIEKKNRIEIKANYEA